MALALASMVQALALAAESLALRFWPWLHYWVEMTTNVMQCKCTAACNRDVTCPDTCQTVRDTAGCTSCDCSSSPLCQVRLIYWSLYLSSHSHSHTLR